MRKYWSLSVLVKRFLMGVLLFISCFVIYKCKNPEIVSDYEVIQPVAVHENGSAFAGGAACISCHKDIYASHINTAHFNTSAIADSLTIKGSFEAGKNTFTLNDRTLFTLVQTDSGY
jgi:hypothetical protein